VAKGQPKAGTREWNKHTYEGRTRVGTTSQGTPKYKYKYTSKKGGGQIKTDSHVDHPQIKQPKSDA
jgi:hypothetical protein